MKEEEEPGDGSGFLLWGGHCFTIDNDDRNSNINYFFTNIKFNKNVEIKNLMYLFLNKIDCIGLVKMLRE